MFYRQPGCFPFRKTVFKTPRLDAFFSQSGDGIKCQYAMRSAAVGNNLMIGIELFQMFFKFLKRNIDRAGHMTCCIFFWRPYIQNGHQTLLDSFEKFFAGWIIEAKNVRKLMNADGVSWESVDITD